MNSKLGNSLLGVTIALSFAAPIYADEPPDGNRYYSLPRDYTSEISVSEAYLAMEHSKGFKHVANQPQPILIDVRSLPEYAAGHPEDAYNVPYPRIGFSGDGTPGQTPEHFYDEVYRIVKGKVDTPIMTLCRTGHRSVLAANILASGEYGPVFTNVRNIWEGFVGQPKYAFKTGSNELELDVNNDGIIDGPYLLDLNNDGTVDPSADKADVYMEVKDANPDKDGWRNFAGLPWSTHIKKPLAYERDRGWYDALNLTPVPSAD